MDYEKAYKEALERAKKWYYAPNADKIPTYANKIISEIFPELKESEDERIRKELYSFFCDLQLRNDREFSPSTTIDEILAWLEKLRRC